MFCEKCGTKLSVGSKFCMNCGAKIGTEEIVQGASALESAVHGTAVHGTAVQETAMQESAVQEAAVSADTPVIEAETAVAEKVTSEIPDVQPVATQHEIPVKEPVRESIAQVIPEQPARPGPIPAQETVPEVRQIKSVQYAPVQNFKNPMSQSINPSAQNIQNPAVLQNVRQPDVSFQSAETDMRPDKVKPLQTWKFVGMLILTGIPLINLIMVLIWSFSGGFNKNTRNFARAVLILWIAGLVLLIITAIVNWAMIQYIWSTFSSAQSGLPPIY